MRSRPDACFPPVVLLAGAVALAGVAGAVPGSVRPSARDLVEIRQVAPGIRVELSYLRSDNAFGRRLYRSERALLRRGTALRLARAQAVLQRSGLGLLVWDAYRPASIHRRLWTLRPGTRYLSSPRTGSKHSRGAAVDVTLVRADGREVPMPTPHDEFSPRAHRSAVKGVGADARRNRTILERAMTAAGFIPNRYEWWHFSDRDWRRYPLLDVPGPAAPPA